MALTFTKVRALMPLKGGFRISIWDVTTDALYVTGGYVITAANFSLNGILSIQHVGVGNAQTTSGILTYNVPGAAAGTNALGKIQVFVGAAAGLALQEAVPSLISLSGQIYRVLVIGW